MKLPDLNLEDLEKQASGGRPKRRRRLATDRAQTRPSGARLAVPEVSFHTAFEADRSGSSERGANWLAAVNLRWNLFNGFADKARIAEADQAVARAEAKRRRTDSAVRLQVRRAYAGLRAAVERIEVSSAAVAEAEESLRITQNRYEAGMANVTDLLRTETAVFESRTRYLAAVHDQRVAAAMLEFAAGSLTADSEVLN